MTTKHYARGASDRFIFCGQSGQLPLVARDVCDDDDIPPERLTRVEKHIAEGDYFATLAAILNVMLVDKKLNKTPVLQKLVCDLLYLQRRYKIVKK